MTRFLFLQPFWFVLLLCNGKIGILPLIAEIARLTSVSISTYAGKLHQELQNEGDNGRLLIFLGVQNIFVTIENY